MVPGCDHRRPLCLVFKLLNIGYRQRSSYTERTCVCAAEGFISLPCSPCLFLHPPHIPPPNNTYHTITGNYRYIYVCWGKGNTNILIISNYRVWIRPRLAHNAPDSPQDSPPRGGSARVLHPPRVWTRHKICRGWRAPARCSSRRTRRRARRCTTPSPKRASAAGDPRSKCCRLGPCTRHMGPGGSTGP